jgi:hypothetical protein
MTLHGDSVAFGRIGSLAVDSSGTLYVGDELAQQILMFDSSGRLLRTLGGKGNGPGEFRSLGSIAWTGNALAALDLSNRRVTFFGTERGDVSTQPWPADAGRPFRLYGAGRTVYAAAKHPRSRQMFSSAAEAAREFRQPGVRYFAITRGSAAHPFLAVEDTAVERQGFDCDGPDHTIETFPEPLFGRDGPLRAFRNPRELAVASRTAYHVDLIDVDSGDTTGVIEREYAPRPVTDEVWELASREFRERERVAGPLDCGPASMRPESLPVIRSMIADERGRLWIEAATPEGFAIAVIDAEGRMLGEAPLPTRDVRVPLYARGGRLYVVTRDDLDVQSIQVFDTGIR